MTGRALPEAGKVGEVAFAASDGQLLAGTFFRAAGAGPIRPVLIGSAMGVGRGFYARFALFLRQRGLSVLTFDYRGTGGSRNGSAVALHQWGEVDLAGALEWLGRLAEAPVGFVGHSVSGQLLGLADNAERVARIVLVAPQSGYWQLWDGWRKLAVAAAWHGAIPLAARLFGRLPGWLSGGIDVPSGVALEWARWGRHPDYILSRGPDTYAGFQRLLAPLLVFSFSDDSYAPPRAVDTLVGWYGTAEPRRRILTPGDAGGGRIGHFGFFDRRFAPTLWREAADWLWADGPVADR